MRNKKNAKEPLLYIQQPVIQKPTASMQYDYYTPRKTEGESKREHVQAPFRKKRTEVSEEYSEEYFEDEKVIEDSQSKENKSVKFKDMSILEKIEYFVHKPEHIPKIQCLIRTDEKMYKGIITELKNDDVYIHEGRRRSSTIIPIERIKSIKMIGF